MLLCAEVEGLSEAEEYHFIRLLIADHEDKSSDD